MRSYRYDREVVDLDLASLEAAKLHESVEMKKLDKDDVVWILGTRNVFQLRATLESYKQTYGNSVEQVIFHNLPFIKNLCCLWCCCC